MCVDKKAPRGSGDHCNLAGVPGAQGDLSHVPLDDQFFLSRLRESLDCAFDSQGKAPGADDSLKHKMERPPASKRFRALASLARVFRDPPTHVDRNAGVESPIPTPHDVDRPSRWNGWTGHER